MAAKVVLGVAVLALGYLMFKAFGFFGIIFFALMVMVFTSE